ncbi:MAG: hypothetical protein KJ767_00940 [Nanoarchaeota archaeon]|nr:hypothetical protein [Nanoarchaeota archaeon]
MVVYEVVLPEKYEGEAKELGIDPTNASSEDIMRLYAKLIQSEEGIGNIINAVCKNCERKDTSIDILLLGEEYEA